MLQITDRKKLEKFINDQGHTWAKVYTSKGDLQISINDCTTAKALIDQLFAFFDDYPGQYCLHLKKKGTLTEANLCKIGVYFGNSSSPALQGAVSLESIEAAVEKRFEEYKRQQEHEDLKRELETLKTTGGKFSAALAGALEILLQRSGPLLQGLLSGTQLQGHPQQEEMEDTSNIPQTLETLAPADRDQVFAGIDMMLKHLTPEEVYRLALKADQQPELLPIIRQFLKA